jgi:uncharacterized protein involved in exopolysaccharide biosynthesis
MALGTVIGALVALAVALWLPNEYRATATLAPASQSGSTSLSRIAGQFGGLAALAGVNLVAADDGSERAVIAMELVRSWSFLEEFIRTNQLEVPILASKGWDKDSDELIIDPDIYDTRNGEWVRQKGWRRKKGPPSSWELYKNLVERISISQDRKTGLITLSAEHYSPVVAKELVDKLIVAINTHIQHRDRDESSRNIAFLEGRLKETTLSGMQQVFSRLIEEQMKNLMLADASSEYALKTISPARVPEEKSAPPRAVILIMGVLLGTGLGLAAWFLVSFRASLRAS